MLFKVSSEGFQSFGLDFIYMRTDTDKITQPQ